MSGPDPFPPGRIAALAESLAGAGLSELEIATDGAVLRLRVDPSVAGMAAAVDAAPPHATAILSRAIGRVSFSGTGTRCPEPGDAVSAGGIVALLRAGELLFPVCSPAAGRLARRLVPEGALVGFGQAIAEVDRT